jgi:hypothetical protein
VPTVPCPERAIERFLRFLDRSAGPDGCWLFTGTRTKGYGYISVGRRMIRSNRFAYAAFVGPIPDGLQVLHRCDVRACCNPAHLFLGTNGDNMRDRAAKPRKGGGWYKLTPDQVEEIRAIFATGTVYQTALAARFGVSRGTIGAIVAGRTHRYADGPLRRKPRLAPDEVRAIRREHAAGGVTFHDVAVRHGLTDGTVARIVKRVAWKDVP